MRGPVVTIEDVNNNVDWEIKTIPQWCSFQAEVEAGKN